MKRPIEFRAMRLDGKGWAHGHYFAQNGRGVNGASDQTLHFIYDLNGTQLVNPDTIGQYTGLTDRNGVKIFEGDCISIDKTKPTILNNRFTVAYSGDAMFVLLNNTGKSGVWGTIARAIELEYRFGYIYVVGNIHESGGGEG